MKILKIEFVEFIPEVLDEGMLYISMKYKTARHRCACGCGNIVIMPITPNDWQLRYNGKGVTFNPSVGNWNFACRSHYWIVENEIRWAEDWYEKKIEENRKPEYQIKQNLSEKQRNEKVTVITSKLRVRKQKKRWWKSLRGLLRL